MALDAHDGGRGEPTAAEAAALITAMMGAGTVGRLDTLHGALTAAYRRGRADVRGEAQELCRRSAQKFVDATQRLVMEHTQEFLQRVDERTEADLETATLPWPDRLRAV